MRRLLVRFFISRQSVILSVKAKLRLIHLKVLTFLNFFLSFLPQVLSQLITLATLARIVLFTYSAYVVVFAFKT
jgi:hypothetical protein